MTTLKTLIQTVHTPVEIDKIDALILSIQIGFSGAHDTLRHQILHHSRAVEAAAVQVQKQRETVDSLFEATDAEHGFLSSVRATLASDRVTESRSRALQHLSNGIKNLGKQLRLARLYTNDIQDFQQDQEQLCSALNALEQRAETAGLHQEAASIQQLRKSIASAPNTLTPALDTMWTQSVPHQQVYTEMQSALEQLSGTQRADTFGEKLGAHLLPTTDAPVADLVRKAAPDWMKRASESAPIHTSDDDFEISDDELRQEAALRRAAEAELDALK